MQHSNDWEGDDVATLLGHPDPRERAMALKLAGVAPWHVATAILDSDPWVWRSAFNHPAAADALDVLAASHRDASGVPIFDRHDEMALDPRCSPAHLAMMYRAARDDAELPEDVKARRLAMLSAHPTMDLHAADSGPGAPALQKHWAHDRIREGSANSPVRAAEEETMPHLGHLEHAYNQHVGGAEPMEPLDADLHMEGSISPKAVYKVPVAGHPDPRRFMVKPYAEEIHPTSGWAEGTSQAIYHAGGIGHLHQQSFVAPHGHGPSMAPALVIHIEDAVPSNHINLSEQLKKRPETAEDARRIAMMDFVSGQSDRHSGNLMVRPDGSPLVIDNATAFEYPGVLAHYDIPAFLKNSNDTGPRNLGAALSKSKLPTNANRWDGYHPTFAWWKKAAPDIKRAFEERLDMIRSPMVAEAAREGFDKRAAKLDEWADGAAAGTLPQNWFLDPTMKKTLAKKLGDADFVEHHHNEMNRRGEFSLADHSQMVGKHPDHAAEGAQYFEKNINKPAEEVNPHLGQFAGMEPKAVYKHADRNYMVKPAAGLNGMGGWNEATAQSLYHAAGIPHLCQHSHITKHDNQEALVVHMDPSAKMIRDSAEDDPARLKKLATDPKNDESLRRIGIMDFVVDNIDRHSGNLMIRPDGSPLAIDNGLAFQNELFHVRYGYEHAADQRDGYGRLVDSNEALARSGPSTPETLAWWNKAKPAIIQRMDQQLEHIIDPEAREKMREVFVLRLGDVASLLKNNDKFATSEVQDTERSVFGSASW